MSIIIWGTQTVRRYQGRVAEFCPVCQTVQPFRLTRVGRAGHVWFISLSSGSLVGYEIKCGACDTTVQAPRQYRAPTKKRGLDLDVLIGASRIVRGTESGMMGA